MATAWTVQRDNRLEKRYLFVQKNSIKEDGDQRSIADLGQNRG